MAILGGSPLGLIGVKSDPTRDGMSTFNGGKSRNININSYNIGKENDEERMKKTNNKSGGQFSLFTGGNIVRPWASIGTIGKEKSTLGIGSNYNGINRRTLHNNDVYDTSILNIIEKTAGTSAALRPSDFAYLKNVGVYPNNRLVIARRFSGPVVDDIFAKGQPPLSVMITWRPESDDFLEISFGEYWVDAKADFKDVLTNVTKDVLGKSISESVGGLFGSIPLPGFTEPIQREILKELGILDETADIDSPVGNPNIIKEAKRRKTLGYGEPGSGLMCKVTVKMTVEYEQKFISGIDPTIVYQDIVANAIRFGTSAEKKFGFSEDFAKEVEFAVNNPGLFIKKISESIGNAIKNSRDLIVKFFEEKTPAATSGTASNQQNQTSIPSNVIDDIIKKVGESLEKTVQKYRLEVEGIVRALSLMPSTPWHVTIGNPLRPIFCSGDMLVDNVNLKLGPALAFNDLPSYITIDFSLTNARNWGATEIMAKFNSGHLRVVNLRKDSNSVSMSESVGFNRYEESNKLAEDTSNIDINNSNANVSNSTETTNSTPNRENSQQPLIDSNPNSGLGAVEVDTTPTTVQNN
jgi:hypothetical protein